ncbi:hypothetical protein A4G27_25115 [Mycobacterium kansasii]|nr:hypothetical protein A4G27_25115 [Mycobacterium kansasii]
MIHQLILRWVVTGLFALPAAECGLAIVTKGRPWRAVVGHGLHLLMAVAMAVMAWPWSARLPSTGPAVFFLLACVWFVTTAVVAPRQTAPRVLYGYHGLMMLATAWMYVTMNGHLLTVRSSAQHDIAMPGMDMPASSASPLWVGAVNWCGTVVFAVAAAFWTSRYVVERQHGAARLRTLGSLGQAMMASGMAILFLAMLFRI